MGQFLHKSKEVHLQAVYRILHYLKGTPENEIMSTKTIDYVLKHSLIQTMLDHPLIGDPHLGIVPLLEGI